MAATAFRTTKDSCKRQETMAKIQYINFCISKFAEHFRMPQLLAYRYLSAFKGLAFLDQCYAAEHLLSAEDAVADLAKVCRRNGGSL